MKVISFVCFVDFLMPRNSNNFAKNVKKMAAPSFDVVLKSVFILLFIYTFFSATFHFKAALFFRVLYIYVYVHTDYVLILPLLVFYYCHFAFTLNFPFRRFPLFIQIQRPSIGFYANSFQRIIVIVWNAVIRNNDQKAWFLCDYTQKKVGLSCGCLRICSSANVADINRKIVRENGGRPICLELCAARLRHPSS